MRFNSSDMMMSSIGAFANSELIERDEVLAEKVAHAALDGMEKIAGIYIDNPTIENIEQFIIKYVLTEMAGLIKTRKVEVSVIPDNFSENKPNEVLDATGIATIVLDNNSLELPFLIRNKELIPFDVIQKDGVRVPYSRDNLKKLIIELENATQVQDEDGYESPYAGVADRTSPATVSGFMGDALAIRDANATRRSSGNYHVAADEYDFIEKLKEKRGMFNERKISTK